MGTPYIPRCCVPTVALPPGLPIDLLKLYHAIQADDGICRKCTAPLMKDMPGKGNMHCGK